MIWLINQPKYYFLFVKLLIFLIYIRTFYEMNIFSLTYLSCQPLCISIISFDLLFLFLLLVSVVYSFFPGPDKRPNVRNGIMLFSTEQF